MQCLGGSSCPQNSFACRQILDQEHPRITWLLKDGIVCSSSCQICGCSLVLLSPMGLGSSGQLGIPSSSPGRHSLQLSKGGCEVPLLSAFSWLIEKAKGHRSSGSFSLITAALAVRWKGAGSLCPHSLRSQLYQGGSLGTCASSHWGLMSL